MGQSKRPPQNAKAVKNAGNEKKQENPIRRERYFLASTKEVQKMEVVIFGG